MPALARRRLPIAGSRRLSITSSRLPPNRNIRMTPPMADEQASPPLPRMEQDESRYCAAATLLWPRHPVPPADAGAGQASPAASTGSAKRSCRWWRASAALRRRSRAKRPAPDAKPKIPDRVGAADGTSAPANAPAAAVAQKVVLYDEDPNDPKGKRYVGSAIWRTETVSPGPGLAPELAIRADVEIPERHLRMTWSLRRNTDKALPASHTIEIMFTLPADFAEGGIGNVPGVLMKQDEQARGVPLAGLAVKVTNGYFLIGLSAVDVDVRAISSC